MFSSIWWINFSRTLLQCLRKLAYNISIRTYTGLQLVIGLSLVICIVWRHFFIGTFALFEKIIRFFVCPILKISETWTDVETGEIVSMFDNEMKSSLDLSGKLFDEDIIKLQILMECKRLVNISGGFLQGSKGIRQQPKN